MNLSLHTYSQDSTWQHFHLNDTIGGDYSMAVDNNGHLWLSPQTVLIEYDHHQWTYHYIDDLDFYNENFESYYQSDTLKIWKGNGIIILIKENFIYVKRSKADIGERIKIDNQDNIWMAYEEKLMKYDGVAWESYYIENSALNTNKIDVLALDGNDNIWIGLNPKIELIDDIYQYTDYGGLVKYDGVNWEFYRTETFTTGGDAVSSIVIDDEDNVWFGVTSHRNGPFFPESGSGFIKYDGTDFTEYNIYNSGLQHNYVVDLKFDTLGNIWAATWGGGVSMYDFNGNWVNLTHSDFGLSLNQVPSLEIDSRNNKWFLFRFDELILYNENGINTGLPEIEDLLKVNSTEICSYNSYTEILKLEFDSNYSGTNIFNIYNLAGALIYSNKLFIDSQEKTEFEFSLHELNIKHTGMYIVEIYSGSNFYSKRLVINN